MTGLADTIVLILCDTEIEVLDILYCTCTLHIEDGDYDTFTVAIFILQNDPLLNVATQWVFTL